VAPEALALLRRYTWPGNVRELQSVLKQALLQATGLVLLPEFLPAYLQEKDRSLAVRATDNGAEPTLRQLIAELLAADSGNVYAEMLRRVEWQLLTQVLQATEGNQRQAARVLGITRGSLRNKLRDLGISIGRTVEGDEP
jgi:two-component system nitrogen regulation response regulator GlnG